MYNFWKELLIVLISREKKYGFWLGTRSPKLFIMCHLVLFNI